MLVVMTSSKKYSLREIPAISVTMKTTAMIAQMMMVRVLSELESAAVELLTLWAGLGATRTCCGRAC